MATAKTKKRPAAKRPTAQQLEKKLNTKVDDLAEKLDRVVDSTNEAIGGINEKFEKLFAMNNPVAPSKTVDAEEQFLGEEGYIQYDQDNVEVGRPGLCDVNSPQFKDKMAMEAFMKEKVKIHIHDTADQNADPNFSIGVNGKYWHFFRNQDYIVPRYVVETMARAKPVHYINEEFRNDIGKTDYRQRERRGLRYGFSVVEDHASGRAWLTRVLAEAA